LVVLGRWMRREHTRQPREVKTTYTRVERREVSFYNQEEKVGIEKREQCCFVQKRSQSNRRENREEKTIKKDRIQLKLRERERNSTSPTKLIKEREIESKNESREVYKK